MNNQQQKPQTITLEYIARLKEEKLEENTGTKKGNEPDYAKNICTTCTCRF